jgi:hypothetical protein
MSKTTISRRKDLERKSDALREKIDLANQIPDWYSVCVSLDPLCVQPTVLREERERERDGERESERERER